MWISFPFKGKNVEDSVDFPDAWQLSIKETDAILFFCFLLSDK